MNNKDILNLTLGQIFAAIAAGMNEGVNTPAATPVAETTVIPPAPKAKAKKAKEEEAPAPVVEEPAPVAEVAADEDDLLEDDLLGEEPEQPKAIKVEDLRAQAVVAIKKDGANKAKIAAILKKIGVDAITNIPPARFEAVLKAFKTLAE